MELKYVALCRRTLPFGLPPLGGLPPSGTSERPLLEGQLSTLRSLTLQHCHFGSYLAHFQVGLIISTLPSRLHTPHTSR